MTRFLCIDNSSLSHYSFNVLLKWRGRLLRFLFLYCQKLKKFLQYSGITSDACHFIYSSKNDVTPRAPARLKIRIDYQNKPCNYVEHAEPTSRHATRIRDSRLTINNHMVMIYPCQPPTRVKIRDARRTDSYPENLV